MAKHLIIIVGATAIGKTTISIELAKHFDIPVVSCDSRQFYKEMTIGTAVPTKDELAAAKHYFIQDRSVITPLTVGSYESEALKLLDELFLKNDKVILVGGSGLYLKSVLEGLDYFPDVDPDIRKGLNERLEQGKFSEMQRELKTLDPESYTSIDSDNPHRVIRALEICIGTGTPFSKYKNQPKVKRSFVPIKIGLMAPRDLMYKRIEGRVDQMIAKGLIEEARGLYKHRSLAALQTVGYQELFDYFEGKIDQETAISEIKKNTRRFAKRQVTWNKKETDVNWFEHPFAADNIIAYINAQTK